MTRSDAEMARIDASWVELDRLIEGLGPEGLALTGADGWQVKDHLAHIAAWEQSLIALLARSDRATAMGLREPTGDTEAINQSLLELHQKMDASAALEYFRDTHARLVQLIESLTDADLQRPYNDYQPDDPRDAADNRPVIDWVASNTYEHYAEHLGWLTQLINESSASR